MRNSTDKEFTRVFQDLYENLTAGGLKRNYMRLDNEVLSAFQALLKEKCIAYQLTPPCMHIRNAAERAIRTFKDNLITGLCSTDPDLPMKKWYHLLDQAEITINLLRSSRLNPSLSAYAQLKTEFYFNRTPMASPVIITLVHDKPHNRGTCSPHGHEGWCVSPEMLHYL